MSSGCFLSYSSVDGAEFALQLHDALEGGPSPIPVWMDQHDLKPGIDWDTQIASAIQTCDLLILIMTRDSVQDGSVCKSEWRWAMRYKRPIVPLLLHRNM